jgi:hypothetical protein
MQGRLREYLEAIAAPAEIAERYEFDVRIRGSQTTKMPLPDGVTAKPFLLTGIIEMNTERGERFLRAETAVPVK